MVNLIYLLVAGLAGYFLGAIPFGFLYVKATKGIDIRHIGSGRTGGTNSFRAAGLSAGLLTGFSDVVKGFGSVWMARLLLGNVLNETWLPWAVMAAAVMAIVGHNWSIFLKWGGGAGTGPNIGWATAIWWPIFPLALIILGGLFWSVGIASVASLTVAATIPIVLAIRYFAGLDPTPAYMVTGILTAAVVTWALRPNIKRLIEGRERIVGPRAKAQRRRMENAESG